MITTVALTLTLLGCGTPTTSTVLDERVNETGLGIAGGHSWLKLSTGELDRQMSGVVDAGATWIRMDLDWSLIEHDRGRKDWSMTDRVVRSARAHGLHVLAILTYSPPWARQDPGPGGNKVAPYPALFGQFVADAVERYRDQIKHWEVWNEPNVTSFFAPLPHVGLYAQLLHQAATAVRTRQPGGQVLVGGLAPAADNGRDIAPSTFIERLYDLGSALDFDAVAVHPYSYPELPSSPSRDNAFQNLTRLRAIMDARGDTSKRLWPTEFGAPTGTGARAVDEQTQAEILGGGLDLMAAMPNIGPVFVYSLIDAGDDRQNLEDNFGMLRRDYSAKPALAQVRARAEVLRAGQ
ncbi:beta-xylosidase [Nocardia sp. NPDC127606]|uniref:beta-xylosidase n=1 Tax=Nocardia sp. NPDC127606 TaxID=3345406 RepID=UPI003626116B